MEKSFCFFLCSLSEKCSEPDEEFVCRYGCEARCGSMKCTVRPRRCVLGCHCKLGLLRDVTGKCVTSEQCLDTPQNNITNVTDIPEVSFLPNGKKKLKVKFIFDDDSISMEDSRESTTNSDNSTDTNNLLKNMNTEQSLPNGRLGVFPPVYEKTSDSRRYFEEVPYTYGRFDTTPKSVFKVHMADSNKKSTNTDPGNNTASINNNKITLDTSRTTDEMTLDNNTMKLPLYPIHGEDKIDFLDKTTVKIDSESNFNEGNNVTGAINVNIDVEVDKKTTANPSSPSTPTLTSNTLPISNKVYLKENNDINPIRVPVSLKQYKPYKDVLSRAVKYYKDITASTPSSYLDMNVIRVPLSYRMGDNLHVLFSDHRKDQDKSEKSFKETGPTFTSYMDLPFSSKSPKDVQFAKRNLFNLANNPFMRSEDTKSMREENMKETIVSNILNVMREILPTPVNFTFVNFAK